MIRVSVLYPAIEGSTFDWSYYLTTHLELAHRLLDPMGLVRIEIDRGIAAFPPGTPSHFHAIGHLHFYDPQQMQNALTTHAAALIADQRKYFRGAESVVQVSEVVEA